MTNVWGPAGWMTLHSISLNYPDNPNDNDRYNVNNFMNAFTESIPCPTCKDDFKNIFLEYKKRYPQWASSRNELFLFSVRSHNTVNAKLKKRVIPTVKECAEAIAHIIKNNSRLLIKFRRTYIDFVKTKWDKRNGTIMEKINNNYWSMRDDRDLYKFIDYEFKHRMQYEDVISPITYNTVNFVPESKFYEPIVDSRLYQDIISSD
jgi:hypothetical protein